MPAPRPHRRQSGRPNRRLGPIALAAALALGASGPHAAPRSFTGPGSFWDVVANWTGGIVPGAGDDALLGAFDTEVRSSFTINSFTGTGALTLSAGTLSFAAASGTGALSLTGGTLAGAGNLLVSGNALWTFGTMAGSGTSTVNSNLTLSGSGVKDITTGRVLNANGTSTWTNTGGGGGAIRMGTGGVINNNGSWLDQAAFDGGISNVFGGAATFNNTGVYTKSGATVTTIGVTFNNTSSGAGTGVVNVNAGTLVLSGGGAGNGSFTGAGTLNLNSGTMALAAGSSVNTANVTFSGGTTTLAGAYNASGTTAFTGGTANFTGTVASSGGALTFSSSGGTANFSNSAGVQFSSLNMQAGTIGGTQAVTFTGPSTWAGGAMTGAGATTFASDLALNTNGLKDITSGRTVNFNGTTTWTTPSAGSGRIRTGSGVTLNNNGAWLDQNAVANAISPDLGGPASFVNAGTYTKSGASTTSISIGFNNTATGVLNLNTGTLQLTGGGSNSGTISVASGTTLELASTSYTLGGSVTGVAGARLLVSSGTLTNTNIKNFGGLLEITNGTFNSDSAFTTAGYTQSAGVVGGTGGLIVTGPASWTGGGMTGNGTTTFAGDVALNTNGLKDIANGRTVNFNGTTTWTNASASQGRIRTGSTATLNNNGTWLDQSAFANSISQDFGGPASTFVNAGTYTKSGVGTTNIAIGFNNTVTGTVALNAGILQLTNGGDSSGAIAVANGTTLEFSGANYTLGGTLAGAAGSRVLVSSGTLTNTNIKNFGGLLEITNGTFNSDSAFTTAGYTQSAGVVGGTGGLIVTGPASWTGGGMTGNGTTTFAGDVALNTNGLKDIANGRTVNFNGTTTWTNASASQGRIRTGSTATLNNNGTWLDQSAFANSISQDFGGPASTFVNAGTYTKSGVGTTNIAIGFNNTATGTVALNEGILQLTNGGDSSGAIAVANGTTLEFSGANYTLGGTLAGAAGSRALVSSGTLTNTNIKNFGGLLEITNGAFNSDSAFTTAGYTQSAGVVGGTGGLIVTGPASWTGGGMTGNGTTTFAGDVALNTNGLKDIANGRTVNFNGTTTWTNASASQGRIRTGSTATLNNNGTWLDQSAFANQISQDFGGLASTFVNAGTYTKSGAAVTAIDIGFNNTGVVNVNAGTLQLGGGGTGTGSFAGAGLLVFSGGTHTLQAASSVGNDNVTFSSGIVNLAGAYNASGTTAFTGGTANFTGTVANSGGALVFTASGGTANFSNSAGVQFASLTMPAGTIGGTQSVTFTGPSTWTGGRMDGAGSTTINGALALTGNGNRNVISRTVTFNGTTTWSNLSAGSGIFQTGSGATLANAGTFLDQNTFSNRIGNDFGGPESTFINTGTYRKTGNAATDISIGFNNNTGGILDVQAGTLNLGGGGNSTGGSFSVASGATIAFSGGTHTLTDITTGSGTGRLVASGGIANSNGNLGFSGTIGATGGAFNFNGTATGGALELSSGNIGGSGSLTVANGGTWTGGQMNGAGSTTINGALAMTGNGNRGVVSRTVTFNGTSTWSNLSAGSGIFQTGSGATLANAGTFLDQNTFSNRIGNDFGGAASNFVNTGTYRKTGNVVTDISIGFNNNTGGILDVQAGTLNLGGGGNSTGGSYSVASGATIAFSGGTHTLTDITTGSGTGRLVASGGIANSNGNLGFSGTIGATGGAFNFNGTATGGALELSSGNIGGSGSLTVANGGTWTGGQMNGAGSTTINGALAMTGNGNRGVVSRTVTFNGTSTWSNLSAGSGIFQTGSGATLANASTWLDQNAFSNRIGNDFGGAASNFVNTGTYRKTGNAVTDISIGFNNTGGTVQVEAGSLNLATLSNFAGTTLTGGTYNVFGPSTLQFAGANVVTNAARILLDGVGSNFRNSNTGTDALASFATNAAAGNFTIRNGRNFTSVGAFNNAGVVNVGPASTFTGGGLFTNQASGQLQMAGGNYAGPSLNNAGVVSGFGAVAPAVSNSGTVRASGGTLTLTGGALGTTGAVIVDTAATLALGANSTARNLTHNGTLLALGANNVTVFNDYDNAGFGVGNSFNRRAGVSGSGQILAAGTTQQTLTGALVTGGTTGSAVLTLPNIRVGLGGISSTFTINNTGVGGPSLRGAIITTGISNAGLSGNGVTAQNWGAIAQSGPGQTFTVSFDPTFGQALSGQVLQVVNNFDNVAGQSLTITGQAFNLASASPATPSPVVFANQRVGGTLSQALTITNTAPNNGFSESLNASISAGGTATAGGSFSLLAAGASSSALFVGVNTATAGAKSGIATITLASDGTGTSGFGALALANQTVNVSGDVYRLASASAVTPSPVVLANQRVGGTLTQALNFTNIAAADGFSESLNASISAGGTATAGGSFSLLAAGASSSALFVGVNTATAGAKSGIATITLASDGTGTSGFGALALANQTVNVSGDVYRLASASAVTPSPVVLANQRVGGTLTQSLSFTNLAAADGFSEGLNASIAAGGTATAGGSFSLLAAGASSSALFVGVNTATAGAKSGIATITLASDGTGTSGFGALALANQTVNVSGDVYRLASASAVTPSPVVLANQRVGGTLTQALNFTNIAAADGFSESLNASIAAGGTATAGGSFSLLAAGASSSTLFVGVNTTTAGAKSGIATITLASDGTGTSGFGALALANQTVNVSGDVYRLASASAVTPSPVVLANQRVGGTLTQALSFTNIAAADGFSESLNASIAAGGTATASGSFSLLAAGASSNALFVGVNTTTAGAKSGIATITLASDGAGTSGFGALALANQTVNVSGDVYRLAQASAVAPAVVSLGNLRTGGVVTQALTLGNLAAADGFSESLNASISGSGGIVTGGAVSLLAAGGSSNALFVGIDTTTGGSKGGTATITLASDGTGTSGFSAFGLGTQTVNVTADVFRLASASAATPNPVLLANQRVGGMLTQALTIANTGASDGFTEALGASISAGGTATAGGSFSLLAAGGSSSALFVGVDTGSAGAKSGVATIALTSDGSGSSGFGSLALGTQTVAVSGSVYRLAQASAATPAVMLLADQRVGGSLLQALTIGNTATADSFSERLSASIAASGGATASGAVSLLAAGSTSTALAVGVDTASAGAKTGSALITLSSDGTGTSGFASFGLGTQNVSVAGNVYRLAQPVVDTTPLTLIGRVGDATLLAAIGVSNNAPDAFTERLDARIASNPAGTSAGAPLLGLAPGAGGSLQLSLATGTAGNFSGPVGVALVSSSAGTTSGAPDFALGSVNVGLTGRVYAPAVAQVAPTVVDFGTVRVGDVVAARTVAVGNGASGALTDTLRASLSGGGAPFTASGSVAGLAAGVTDSTSLQVALSTASAGVFSGSASVQMTSQNPDLADLVLAPVAVNLQGQVNNLAQGTLAQAGGSGSFSGGAFSYTLDFGSVQAGGGSLSGQLVLGNGAIGTADALAGNWVLGAGGGAFAVSGFDTFSGLAAGATLAGLTVTFDLGTEGSYDRVLVLQSLSTNGSGPDLVLGEISLHLQGSVVAVPEPGTYLMMVMGLVAIGGLARRRLRAARP